MSGVAPTASDTNLEREKWQADLRLREREHSLKEDELRFKQKEVQRSRWANPLVLAVLAAALAAAGNAAVAYINGAAQRQLEEARTKNQETIEETKAEAARILEVIKTDPKVALQNLAFLVDVGLIINDQRRTKITEYIEKTPPGQGPSLRQSASALKDLVRDKRKLELMMQLSAVDFDDDPAEVKKIVTALQSQIRALDAEEERAGGFSNIMNDIMKRERRLERTWIENPKKKR